MKTTLRNLTVLLVLGSSVALHQTGCTKSTTRQSTGEYIDDTAITAKVKAAFAQDPGVKAIDVKVDTFKGTVQLAGFVDTDAEKKRAEELARDIPGVKKVENKILLKASRTP